MNPGLHLGLRLPRHHQATFYGRNSSCHKAGHQFTSIRLRQSQEGCWALQTTIKSKAKGNVDSTRPFSRGFEIISANPRYLQIPYLLKLTHNSKSTLGVHLRSFVDMHRATEIESPNVRVPSRGQAKRPLSLPSGFSSHTVNK